jgi:hypothetical protein
MSAIDEFMPVFLVRSRHSVWIRADPARVRQALSAVDLGRPWTVRVLMGLRSLPVRLRRRTVAPEHERSGGVLGLGFTLLAETPEELLLGLQGRFWTPSGGLVAVEPAHFAAGPPAGLAQAVWNFRLAPERGGSRLTTETRVRIADPRSARQFRRYWLLIAPFSGLMRRRMLALVRRTAEARAAAA